MKKLIKFHLIPYLKVLGMVISYPIWMRFSCFKRHRFLNFFKYCRNSLPVIYVDDIIPENFSDNLTLTFKALKAYEHNCTSMELFVLGLFAKVLKVDNAYEIGTYDGRSSLAIACNLEISSKLYTLNLPENYFSENPVEQSKIDVQLSTKVKSGYRFLRQPEKSRIIQCWGNSMNFTKAQENAPYELIFIDGAHDYETVKYDSYQALKLINRKNGIILWHDSTNYGVGKWLPELIRKGYNIYRIYGTDMAFLQYTDENNIKYSNVI